MKSSLPRGIKQLLEEAKSNITEIEPAEALKLVNNPDWLIVDVRDIRERQRDGYIEGSFHCPRGMVEFWIDPDSPYFKPEFGQGKKLLFHCALDWRSALTVSTVTGMGVKDASHLKGGLKGWKEANGPVVMPSSD